MRLVLLIESRGTWTPGLESISVKGVLSLGRRMEVPYSNERLFVVGSERLRWPVGQTEGRRDREAVIASERMLEDRFG